MSRPPVTFVFGTGLTIGLSNNHRASSWSGLLQEVLKEWEKHVHGRSPEVSAPGWVLTRSTDGDCLVAAAYVLRRQMMAQVGSPISLQSFGDAVKAAVQALCDRAIEYVAANPTEDPGIVGDALRVLGRKVLEGKARLLTTNYDDIVARLANLKVLLPDGRYFEPLSPTMGHSAIEHIPDFGAPERLRRMSTWRHIDHSAASPRQSGSVLHLHGWHGQAEAIVIDPVDYHVICDRAKGARDERTAMIHTCNDTVIHCMREGPVVYYGVGAGMLDPHFELLRTHARDSSGTPKDLTSSNFWILTQKDIEDHAHAWFKQMGSNSTTIIEVADHHEAALLLHNLSNKL